MADIELVVKISEEIYEIAKQDKWKWPADDVYNAIKNGTLLPKEHGRLIDADELTKEIKNYISDTSNLHYDDLAEAEAYNSAYCNCLDEIEDTSTIIEADKTKSGDEE